MRIKAISPYVAALVVLSLTLLQPRPLRGDDRTAGAADKSDKSDKSDKDRKLRVACVGDSITFGSGIADRAHNSYPAQLARLLGDRYDVRNFGVSGATLLKNGDKPYWKEKAFQEAKDFQPDLVVIKLGTNDSKPQNWKHKDEFVADARDLVREFSGLPSHPRVFVCRPVPAYPGNWGIRDEVIRNEVIPLLDEA